MGIQQKNILYYNRRILRNKFVHFQPPHCGKNLGGVRRRRQIGNDTSEEGAPATIEVYSGLYVNEATDGKNDIVDHVQKEKVN